MTRITLALFALIALAGSAMAAPCGDWNWADCAMSEGQRDPQHRYRYYRYYHQHRHHRPRYVAPATRVYSYVKRVDDYRDDRYRDPRDDQYARSGECRRTIDEVGGESGSEQGAKNAAAALWQGKVRFMMGEVWMDIDRARDIRYTCTRSSTNESLLGKAQEVAGALTGGIAGHDGVKHRCRIEARPCHAPMSEVGSK